MSCTLSTASRNLAPSPARQKSSTQIFPNPTTSYIAKNSLSIATPPLLNDCQTNNLHRRLEPRPQALSTNNPENPPFSSAKALKTNHPEHGSWRTSMEEIFDEIINYLKNVNWKKKLMAFGGILSLLILNGNPLISFALSIIILFLMK
jgi:hypothetical protein